jgi:hypothetical protein
VLTSNEQAGIASPHASSLLAVLIALARCAYFTCSKADAVTLHTLLPKTIPHARLLVSESTAGTPAPGYLVPRL